MVMALYDKTPPKDSICISIRGPYDSLMDIKGNWKASLKMCFDANDTFGTGMTDDHADQIVQFCIDTVVGDTSKIVVHCGEGCVRSAAVAKVLAHCFRGYNNKSPSGYSDSVFWKMKGAMRRLCYTEEE